MLRYDKRRDLPPNLTVKDEVIDDAAAAVEVLRSTPKIDRRRVFVLGHSLGAMLIPRIAAAAADARGFICMAAPARPLEDAILEQSEYLHSPNMDQIKAEVSNVKNIKPGDGPVFGAPASYWVDLRGFKPAEAARAITRPLLVIHGDRDYQVTTADFDAWKAALKGHSNVTFKSYPGLNHLFMPGEGKPSPQEYERPQHIAANVLDDIATWVRSH